MACTRRTYTVKEKADAPSQAHLRPQDVSCGLGAGMRAQYSPWLVGPARRAVGLQGVREVNNTLKGQGRKEAFPYAQTLVTFMKDKRREEKWLTTWGMIQYIVDNYPEWLQAYLSDEESKQSGQAALEKLCQRLAKRHGFSTQKPQESKMVTEKHEETRARFSIEFWKQYSEFGSSGIYNADETAINFDMPPQRLWAVKGRKGSAKVASFSKHSGRMMAVLTVRADGKKLPILFIVRGKLGGKIDSDEICMYPKGHYYTVQEHAWMDATGWEFYVVNVLQSRIDSPSVLLLDNFDSHVSEEGQRVIAEEACATVVPLPPNSTAPCQPLDVGVMGPLKSRIRAKNLCGSGLTAREKRINAIKATIAAWDEISEDTVISSFQKAIPRYPEVHV